MKNTGTIITLLFAAVVILSIACQKEKANPQIECPREYKFSADVLPILTTKCRFPGCHGDASNSGFTMNTYAEFKWAVENKGVLAAIKHEGPVKMPRLYYNQPAPDSLKLHDTLIQAIDCWVRQGMLDN
ncbi:MAG: hypothetical protein ACOZCO_12255 [Bacteroidota bacterium]